MNQNIALFKSQLDSISADIKHIQASLRDANVPSEIRHFCKKEALIGSFRGFEAFGFGPGIETTKYLVWNVYQNNGNQSDWYLLYEETEQKVAFEGDSYVSAGDLITKVKKPLIECKAPIRIEMYGFLGGFIEEVSKRLQLQDFKETQRGAHSALRQFLSLQPEEKEPIIRG
jgi:hypothetical protein